MLFSVAGFEFRYQTRQPIFWVAVLFFGLMAFGSVASSNIQIGSTDNVHKNAAFVIGQTHLVLALIYMFVTAAFVSNVVVRDDETGFGSIIRSTSVSRFDYLYGRFLGAFAAAALAFAAVPAGLLLGAFAPWVDRETLGPISLWPYVYAYGLLALPFLFLSAVLFFVLTTVTRSMMWTYVGVVGLMVFRGVFGVLTRKPELQHIAALWDPFGLSPFLVATRYWTPIERNSLTPPIVGDMLWNKVIWLSAAVALLAAAQVFYRARDKAPLGARKRPAGSIDVAGPSSIPTFAKPTAAPVFNSRAVWAQLIARTRLDAAQVFGSPAFFVLLGLSACLSIVNLWLATDVSNYGGKIFPVTRLMVQVLGESFTFFSVIIAIYYAGELVWREREKRTHEIIDATPTPDWIFIAPKTLAIGVVLTATLASAVVVACAIQAIGGYFDFRLDRYLLWWIVPGAVDAVLLAVLAIFVQALSPHKFIGWAVMAVYLISTIVLSNLGFEHNLYNYGGAPQVPLSDMNGQGRFWIGAAWFRLYWSAFALILLVVAYGLWRRGTETRFLPRFRRLPARLRGVAGGLLAIGIVVFAGSGVFIYINTNVWNEYRTKLGVERWTADYEKAFLRYENLSQPKITKVKLDIQIWPRQTRLITKGTYILRNETTSPISVLHLRFDHDVRVDALTMDGARLLTDFKRFNYRIYALDRPLQPGETRSLSFATTREERGFRNSGDLVDTVYNGTFVDDALLVPKIGMDRQGLLADRTKRRQYGLIPELRMAKLGDPAAVRTSFGRHDSDWVTADITVTTDADQIPVAPGYRVSETVAGGRRTIRYVTESPVLNFFAALSARYAVSTDHYKGVDISVYYDPQHPWNVARIQQGMRMGLDYFQANFSPYQFHQVRVLEFPVIKGEFAQSFANTIPWSEGIFFIADTRDLDRIDMVTYVGAHELGHQWWAHQVIGADEQGSTMLDETLAQYSAMMVLKHHYGPDMMRKFLKFELDNYLKSRGAEISEELPLERVENQGYIHYRKGSLVMYRLQDEIGEEAVNRALRHLIRDFAFKNAPYPTALDLVADLRAEAPADKQSLITDLFERITLYDFKTTGAVATRLPDGRYSLGITIVAKKLHADGQGHESAAPMNETVPIGAFDIEPSKPGFSAGKVVTLTRAPIHDGVQTVNLIVSRLPRFAGVDPYNTLIDRNSEANVTAVTLR